MVWLPDGKKNFKDTFIRFAMIHERDGRTDGQTPHHSIYRVMHKHHAVKIAKIVTKIILFY